MSSSFKVFVYTIIASFFYMTGIIISYQPSLKEMEEYVTVPESLGEDDIEIRNREETPDNDQVKCMAINLYFEAGNQKAIEQEAIAHVVMNRVKDSSFPDTICGVVYDAKLDSGGNPIRNRCQFSWFCDGKDDHINNKKIYSEILDVSKRIVGRDTNGERDPTDGSLWYHAHYVNPYWAKAYRKQLQIGAHIFYAR